MAKKIYKIIENMIMWFVELFFKLIGKELQESTKDAFKEFIKFGLVGVSNTVVTYVIYVLTLLLLDKLNIFEDIDYFIANIVSFLLSVLWSFYWNNKYVFRLNEGEHRSIWTALLKTYMSYAFTGLILNNVMLYVWVRLLHLDKMLAPIMNIVINIPINFFMNKLWAFKKTKE